MFAKINKIDAVCMILRKCLVDAKKFSINILNLMGADISLSNEREVGGEPVADIRGDRTYRRSHVNSE